MPPKIKRRRKKSLSSPPKKTKGEIYQIIVSHCHQHIFATAPDRYDQKSLKKLKVILAEKFPSTENYNVHIIPK